MHRITTALTAVLALGIVPLTLGQDAPTTASGEGAAKQETKPPPPPIYDESADAGEQIAEALARAKEENRRVLIQWGANWCGWCRVLHKVCEKNRDVRRKLSYEYDVVLVDIGRWDKHLDLVKRYGADLEASGVPYLTILNAEGDVVVNHSTVPFEVKQDGEIGHDPEKLTTFLAEHQAPYLSAEAILSEALTEAARTDRKVFLHFGAPWCGWCHRFEEWMARKEVAEILATDFVGVKIDVDRTKGGQEMMGRYTGGEKRGIPWFAFLDADGSVLATSDTPDGNLGCPYTEKEIAAFAGLLSTVKRRITDEQLAALVVSLTPEKKNSEDEPAPATQRGAPR